MHASEFSRKRARLQRRAGNRAAFLRKGMTHLVREAGAREIVVRGQVVGWRMTGGEVVCIKVRFRDLLAAQLEIQRIAKHSVGWKVPVRAYQCQYCGGWHLTSQAKA